MDTDNKHERRLGGPPPHFPFFDSDNNLVRKDRRSSQSNEQLETMAHPTPPGDIHIEKTADAFNTSPKIAHTLILNIHNQFYTLTKENCPKVIGRMSGVDFFFNNIYVSRTHARIEFIDDAPVIIDQSRNGTFISIQGQPRIHLINNRYNLHDRGTLSLGAADPEQQGETIQFSCK